MDNIQKYIIRMNNNSDKEIPIKNSTMSDKNVDITNPSQQKQNNVRNKNMVSAMSLREVLNVAVDENHTLEDIIKSFPEKIQPKLIRTLDVKLPRFSGKQVQFNWLMNKCVILTDFMKIWSEKDSGYYYRFQFIYCDELSHIHPTLIVSQNGSREIKAVADVWEKERNEKGGNNNAIKKSVIGQKLHIRRIINKGNDGSDKPTNSYYFEEYHWDDAELADVMIHSYGINTSGLGDEDLNKMFDKNISVSNS